MALTLDRTLVSRLQDAGVHIDAPDANTIRLTNVPANAARFTKDRTNVLMQRPRAGMPFILGVDEDFEYVGPDAGMARLFAAGLRQRGWRVLRMDLSSHADLEAIVERALGVVGFDGREPTAAMPPDWRSARLGAALGTSLTALVRDGSAQPTIGRGDDIEAVAAVLLQHQPRLPVVVADAGVGKTNLLHGLARRMAIARPSFDVVRVDLADAFAGTLFDAERENALAAVLKDAVSPGRVLCLEHLELIALALPEGPLLLNGALDKRARVVGTTSPVGRAALQALPLNMRLHVVELGEPRGLLAREVVLAWRGELAAHHRVSIDDAVVDAAIDRAATLAGFFPGKAIALLDAAASRAALDGSATTDVVHVYLVSAGSRETDREPSW